MARKGNRRGHGDALMHPAGSRWGGFLGPGTAQFPIFSESEMTEKYITVQACSSGKASDLYSEVIVPYIRPWPLLPIFLHYSLYDAILSKLLKASLNKPLTEISSRNVLGGKVRPVRRADILSAVS